jgi:hypothetical protein
MELAPKPLRGDVREREVAAEVGTAIGHDMRAPMMIPVHHEPAWADLDFAHPPGR